MTSSVASKQKSWLTVPEPIRILFDKFPLETYPAAPITPSITFPCNQQALSSSTDPKDGSDQSKRTVTLYVHKLTTAESSHGTEFLFPTDPTSIEILGYLRLKNLGLKSIDGPSAPIRMLAVSPHSAPQGNLPYLIDITPGSSSNKNKKTRAVYSTPAAVYRNLLAPISSGEPALYRSMISTVLRDAWIFMLIDPETPLQVRQRIFGEGPFRVPNIDTEKDDEKLHTPLPQFVESYLVDSYTLELAEQLRPRYPAVVESLKQREWLSGFYFIPSGINNVYKKVRDIQTQHVKKEKEEKVKEEQSLEQQRDNLFTAFFSSPKGQAVRSDVYSRAAECLQVFVSLIEESSAEHGEIHGDGTGNRFIGIGGHSTVNEDVREYTENNSRDGGLGPLDVMLFAYVYSITQYAKDTQLCKIITQKFPELVKHCEKVYSILF